MHGAIGDMSGCACLSASARADLELDRQRPQTAAATAVLKCAPFARPPHVQERADLPHRPLEPARAGRHRGAPGRPALRGLRRVAARVHRLGRTAGQAHGALLELVGGQAILQQCVERRCLPDRQGAADERLQQIERDTGWRPRGKGLRELKGSHRARVAAARLRQALAHAAVAGREGRAAAGGCGQHEEGRRAGDAAARALRRRYAPGSAADAAVPRHGHGAVAGHARRAGRLQHRPRLRAEAARQREGHGGTRGTRWTSTSWRRTSARASRLRSWR